MAAVTVTDWERVSAPVDSAAGDRVAELVAELEEKTAQLAKARALLRSLSKLEVKPARVESIDDADPLEQQIIGYEIALASWKARANLFLGRVGGRTR